MSRAVSSLIALVSTVAVTVALQSPGVGAQQKETTTERSLRHGGRTRTYLVHDFGTGEPAPVVIVLHGGGGNAGHALRMTATESAAARTSTWTACASGAPVVFHSVAGNGHAWPGGEAGRRGAATPTTRFDATDAMWAFFTAQRRNGP